jgi:hypothetical protein
MRVECVMILFKWICSYYVNVKVVFIVIKLILVCLKMVFLIGVSKFYVVFPNHCWMQYMTHTLKYFRTFIVIIWEQLLLNVLCWIALWKICMYKWERKDFCKNIVNGLYSNGLVWVWWPDTLLCPTHNKVFSSHVAYIDAITYYKNTVDGLYNNGLIWVWWPDTLLCPTHNKVFSSHIAYIDAIPCDFTNLWFY